MIRSLQLALLNTQMGVLLPISWEAVSTTMNATKLNNASLKMLVFVFSVTTEILIEVFYFLRRVLLWRCKLGVLQYTVVRPVTTVIAL